MASTIVTKNSSTASAVPVTGDLTQGELAVNVTDKKLYTKDSGGTVVKLVGGLGNQEANAVAITGGSVNGTTIGATTASTGAFTTLSASSTTTLSGGTANGVAYLNGSKVVTTGSALTFDGTTLTGTSATSAANLVLNNTNGATQTYVNFTSGATVINVINRPNATNDFRFDANYGSIVWGIGSAGTATEQMRLTSTGLGIGTSSPSAPLTVQGNASGYGINIIGRSAGQNEAWLYWYKNGGSTLNAGILGDNQGLKFAVDSSATERMRLDSSGNLGLGVTPSAWLSGAKAIQIGAGGYVDSRGSVNLDIGSNAYIDSSASWRYINTGAATQARMDSGAFSWLTAPSGTAGNAISFTQAMTLDASGNLGVGTTSPGSYSSKTLQVTGSSTDVAIKLTNTTTGSGSGAGFDFELNGNDINYVNRTATGVQKFWTNATERARIDSSGNLLVGTTSYGGVSSSGGNAYFGAGGTSSVNTGFLGLNGSSASGYGAGIGGYSNGTNSWFIGSYGFVVSGTNTFLAMRNSGGGGVYLNGSTATSWTAVSDETRKVIIEDITDAANKVSTLRTVIGRLKTDDETVRRPYLIAQDVQAVLPEAVSETEDKEGPVLGLSYTEVIPLLVAAIKEQQALITQLTERITALEGK